MTWKLRTNRQKATMYIPVAPDVVNQDTCYPRGHQHDTYGDIVIPSVTTIIMAVIASWLLRAFVT